MLENVRSCTSAKETWKAIINVFEKHTVPNKLSARRSFYNSKVLQSEDILMFSNQVDDLASILKSMKVQIDCED